MSNHPCHDAPSETVRADAGAWISGPGVNTEATAADEVTIGNRLIIDGIIAEVTAVVRGPVRQPGAGYRYAPGRALWWKQRGGTQSGVLVRADTDTVERIRP